MFPPPNVRKRAVPDTGCGAYSMRTAPAPAIRAQAMYKIPLSARSTSADERASFESSGSASCIPEPCPGAFVARHITVALTATYLLVCVAHRRMHLANQPECRPCQWFPWWGPYLARAVRRCDAIRGRGEGKLLLLAAGDECPPVAPGQVAMQNHLSVEALDIRSLLILSLGPTLFSSACRRLCRMSNVKLTEFSYSCLH